MNLGVCLRDVTQKPFDGCIKNVTLGSTNRDLNDGVEVKGVLSGCPEVSSNGDITHHIVQERETIHVMIVKYYSANYMCIYCGVSGFPGRLQCSTRG